MKPKPRAFPAAAFAVCALLPAGTGAAPLTTLSAQTEASYDSLPLTGVDSTPPLVMLTLSRDHQLHFKAYPDDSDLDGDGIPETTYKGNLAPAGSTGFSGYYGYFDPSKCYVYGDGSFAPATMASFEADASGLPNAARGRVPYCHGQWSGNFLNWLSMTRMDALRKLLYGGMRSTDSATLTVLERDYLPTDAHAFAKYYAGADIARLTPFSDIALEAPTLSTAGAIGAGAYVALDNSSLVQVAGSAMVTVSAGNAFIAGESVLIAGTGIADWDGVRRVLAADSASFSFAANSSTRIRRSGTGGIAAGRSQLLLPVPATTAAPVALGDQLRVVRDAANRMSVVVTALLDASGREIGAANAATAYVRLREEGGGTSPVIESLGEGASTTLSVTNLSAAGLSFCNLTPGAIASVDLNLLSQTNTRAPLLRVARGNYALWSANAGYQCHWLDETSGQQAAAEGGLRSDGNRAALSGIEASAENPSQFVAGLGSGSAAGEFVLRVQACEAGLAGSERCETYPGGSSKPIGLLQLYGESGRIQFGLLSTSYGRNLSGGVLRKNAGTLADEVDVAGDGHFTGTGGIIQTLNRLRIYGYNYAEGGYGSADACGPELLGLSEGGGRNAPGALQGEGHCASWGNPIGEAFVETLRYLAGKTPDARFAQGPGGPDAALGLTAVSPWKDPLGPANACAALNVMLLNASVPSYDDDQLSGLGDLAGRPSALASTNTVGVDEGLSGKYFVGSNGVIDDGSCSAKSVTDLGAVTGICPEAPGARGSYLLDGAAFYAHTHRIRSDLGVPAEDPRALKVNTYGIQLATDVPRILVPDPSDPARTLATLLPVYRLDIPGKSPPYGGGAIVDFRIVARDPLAGSGKFYVSWDDSAQGGDYDQDLWGTISYQVNADRTITVTTAVVSAAAKYRQGFGYIISGTSQDGPHFHSGSGGFDYGDPANVSVRNASGNILNGQSPGIDASGGCDGCIAGGAPTAVTYRLSSGIAFAQSLQDPLWYAAKYGGFVDAKGIDGSSPDGTPANSDGSTREWDARGSDGSLGADQVPDNYFRVTSPGALESSLGATLNTIVARGVSGTAAAVLTGTRQGEGAMIQALYAPSRSDAQNRTVNWTGSLQALLVDRAGNLREDGNGDGRLEEDDYAADPAVRIVFNAADRQSQVIRFHGDPAASSGDPPASLDTLKPLWNAATVLAKLTDPQNQRVYGNAITARGDGSGRYTGGRYIFTFRDHGLGPVPDKGTPDAGRDVVAFMPASFDAGEYGILNLASADDASSLVSYIRGEENPRLRRRALDIDGDGTPEVLRLGDIVNSSPVAVGAPAEAFNLLYRDAAYAAFVKRYRHRRSVVYVGANDGMVHAFNAGFYDPARSGFGLSGERSETAHPLGAELWAYIPFNLLPHLGWLSDPAYGHVWYADGAPRVFDARVFADDADHPGGWGTLLVIGMRLGGGTLNLPVNATTAAGFSAYATALGSATSLSTRSAYVVMDISNPEVPPRLVAELTDPPGRLGFTTSVPTAVAFRPADGSTPEKWYLVFGSGPTEVNPRNALDTAGSSQNAQLFVYDLGARQYLAGYAPYDLGSAAAASFVGNPVAVDWDLNYKADALYFGTASGAATAPGGKLFRLDFHSRGQTGNGDTAGNESSRAGDWIAPVPMLDAGVPILAAPSVTQDNFGRKWVLSGSGRYLAPADKSSAAPQLLFGVIDRLPNPANPPGAANFAGLVDTSLATVSAGPGPAVIGGVTGATSETALENLVAASGGWKLRLDTGAAAERSVTGTSVLSRILFATTFTPPATSCGGDGSSRLFALNFETGAALPGPPVLGTGTQNTASGVGVEVLKTSVALGAGFAAAPSVHLDSGPVSGSGAGVGGGRLTLSVQTSGAAVVQTQARTAGTERSGEIDWRETHPRTAP